MNQLVKSREQIKSIAIFAKKRAIWTLTVGLMIKIRRIFAMSAKNQVMWPVTVGLMMILIIIRRRNIARFAKNQVMWIPSVDSMIKINNSVLLP
jgi:hypothetical protein